MPPLCHIRNGREMKMGSYRMTGKTGMSSGPCIWMQAGVVPRKYCQSDYECAGCRYDRALSAAAHENRRLVQKGETPGGRRGRIMDWKDKLRKRPLSKQPCIHHMKARIGYRICNNDYNCGSCEFDQYFQDQFTVHAVVKPVDVFNIQGFKVPQGYYLHRGHAWVKLEEGASVRVGIDDFVLRVLGPPDQALSPLIGKEVTQDSPDIILKRGEKQARMLSPVTGVVTAVNPVLRENGRAAGESPYAEGWMMRVQAKNLRKDLRNLMMGDETKTSLARDVDRLYGLIEETVGPLAADGGYLADDLYGNLPQIGWDRLTRLFLHT